MSGRIAEDYLDGLTTHAQLVRSQVGEDEFRFWLLQSCRAERLTLGRPQLEPGKPHLRLVAPPPDGGDTPPSPPPAAA